MQARTPRGVAVILVLVDLIGTFSNPQKMDIDLLGFASASSQALERAWVQATQDGSQRKRRRSGFLLLVVSILTHSNEEKVASREEVHV